jgi:hypothetical protein
MLRLVVSDRFLIVRQPFGYDPVGPYRHIVKRQLSRSTTGGSLVTSSEWWSMFD